jgi:PAS domain-containing protein
MLGIPVASLLGEAKEARMAGWNVAERAALEANMAARRPFLDYIFSRIDASGAHQYFQVSGEPIFDAAGRFTGYRGVGRDISGTVRDLNRPHAA